MGQRSSAVAQSRARVGPYGVARDMQTSEGAFNKQGVVIAPDPSRSKYDIEIPWLIHGKGARSRALENFDPSTLRALFHDPSALYSGQSDASVESNDRILESPRRGTIDQGLPVDTIVLDIVGRIVNYTGIHDAEHYVSRVVRGYLERRCFGKQLTLNDSLDFLDQINASYCDYIARYLSREFVQIEYNPTCLVIAMSSTNPFTWTYDIPLIKASKTIFNYVATSHQHERHFAQFLDRCRDVLSFTSLGVAEDSSWVIRGQDGLSLPSILPCDPDWAVAHYYNGNVRYWIVGTKQDSSNDDPTNEFMTNEWCKIASQSTGNLWRYISVGLDIDLDRFPSFQALVVDDVCRSLGALSATQRVSTSLDEILQMRDEGRRL